MKLLGMQESPVKVYGWIQNSYTGNMNGTPKNGMNFGVNSQRPGQPVDGQPVLPDLRKPPRTRRQDQLRLPGGQPVRQRLAVQPHARHDGHVAKPNHFNGYDPAQFYAEIHLPGNPHKGGTRHQGRPVLHDPRV